MLKLRMIDGPLKTLLFWSLVLILVGLFLTLARNELGIWRGGMPLAIEFQDNSWQVFSGHGLCDERALAGENCLAHPARTELWSAGAKRTSTERPRFKRDEFSPIVPFWLGKEISKDTLKRAKELQADFLVIGWILGKYQIWLNGKFLTSGGLMERDPIILPLSYLGISTEQPLKIAIAIEPSPGTPFPDMLARPLKTGLATKQNVAGFSGMMAFWRETRPFSLFLLNLTFAFIFFFLWRTENKRREYFFLTLYSLSSAAMQLRAMGSFMMVLGPGARYAMDIVLRYSEGAIGMLLALAFAKVRNRIFSWAIGLSFLIPISLVFILPDGASRYLVNGIIDQWVVPVYYLAGVTVCVWMAFSTKPRIFGEDEKNRVQHLLFFAAGMFLIAVFHIANAHGFFSMIQRIIGSRFVHLGLIAFLGLTAIAEYRNERRLLDRTPLSKYHRAQEGPTHVNGAVLSVDLKKSEMLFRSRSSTGQRPILEICMSELWSAVRHASGTLISAEGDMLVAVFDRKQCEDPVFQAVQATVEMEQRLGRLRAQYQHLLSVSPLSFRGGITAGELKAVWNQMDEIVYPAWQEAGNSCALVDVARMLELEKEVSQNRPETVVVLPSVLAAHLGGKCKSIPGLDWVVENRELKGKHARSYSVSAYRFLVGLPI